MTKRKIRTIPRKTSVPRKQIALAVAKVGLENEVKELKVKLRRARQREKKYRRTLEFYADICKGSMADETLQETAKLKEEK